LPMGVGRPAHKQCGLLNCPNGGHDVAIPK
jgi:hypothetical protein